MPDNRVLVAEDDPDLRRLLHAVLVTWGYRPILTADGLGAIEALCRPDGPPRAILDWMMPGADGVEVVRRVRAETGGRELQILLLTARERPEDVVAALEAGADDYITKPFDFAVLHARLRKGPRAARAADTEEAPLAAPEVGAVLGGRWRLEEHLARGGMGVVWRATHVDIGNEVAVKTIRADRAGSAIHRARFEAEARATSRLRSPFIAQVFDYGIGTDGSPYLVMELLRGSSLGACVARDGPLSPARLSTVISHIARALSHAHGRGLVHRDVKPDNVFLEDLRDDAHAEGPLRAKLIDFGIARITDRGAARLTGDGAFVGTPGYSSPEQFLGEEVGPASDLWSLGAVAYLAATGSPPLRRGEAASVAAATLDEEFPVPSRARPDLPLAFDRWMARACARCPADRFQNALEMGKALRDALGVASGAARSAPSRPLPRIAPPADATSTVMPVSPQRDARARASAARARRR